MARKARVEFEGGLYHVITRGNNRRQICNSRAAYEKFLSLLASEKTKNRKIAGLTPVLTSSMLASTLCLSQLCCGSGALPPGQNHALTKEQGVSSSPLAQSGNQTNSRMLSGEDHWVKGNSLRADAKYEEAAKEYQLAIDNGYDSNWVRTELGIVLDYYLHRPEEAAVHFRVAIERDQKDWRAHWSLANSLVETKQYDEALKEIQIVKQLDPKNTAAGSYIYETAKALDGLGRIDEALKEYEAFLQRAKKVEPNSQRVREVRARVEAIKGKC